MPPKATTKSSAKRETASAPVVDAKHLHGMLMLIDSKTGKMHKIGEVYSGKHNFAM